MTWANTPLSVLALAGALAVAGCSAPVGDASSDPPATTTSTAPASTTSSTTTTSIAPSVEPGCGPPPDHLAPPADEPVRVIFDTDFGPDVDDAGALALLHAMADRGEADILAVMLSTAEDFDGPGAVDVVNTYYGRPDIPIGLAERPAPSIPSRYTEAIAASFPNEGVPTSNATSLYRQILAAQPDRSVTLVSVGFMTNLDDLLLSGPDEFSPLGGADLVAEKVRLWVAMAGVFPDSSIHPRGVEYNLAQDLPAAVITTTLWPTPVVFSGHEVGSIIETGGVLQDAVPVDNPVREAYRLYTGGDDRASFDLTAVWYAVRGAGGFFDTCQGRIVIDADGTSGWDPTAEGHAYLEMVAEPAVIAEALDDLLIAAPERTRDR